MTSSTRLAVDVSALQVDSIAERGIGRYVSAYSAALARAGRVEAALLVPELPPPSNLPGELVGAGVVCWDSVVTARRLMAADAPLVHHVTAPFLYCRGEDPACLGVAQHWAASGVARVVTVYDLIPLRAPRHYLTEAGDEERYRARAAWVAQADLLLAISEHTRSELVDLLGCDPAKVAVVGAGVSPFFSPPDGTDDELWRFHLGALDTRPYLLTVGGSDSRKNTERLIWALGVLADRLGDLDLVVVGGLDEPTRLRLLEASADAGVADRVLLTGAISDDALRAAYRRTILTVVPSLSEGSGLPVLESAACSTPALASSTTSLGEVAATHLATFDPGCVESMAGCIELALTDEHRRRSILAAQRDLLSHSTWEAVAHRAVAAIDRLGGGEASPSSLRSLPVRVALVGPLPPYGGGIGVFHRRLAEAMPREVQVDVVGTGGHVEPPEGANLVAAASLGVDFRPSSYDAVVYTLGNSSGHLRTVELALRYPGWIWLHEARLPAIATSAMEDLDEEAFRSEMSTLLRRAYPGRAPLGAALRAGRSNLDLVAAGVGLITPLAQGCQGFIVNSELARRLVELDLPPLSHRPPIEVLPLPCPPIRDASRRPPREITRVSDALVVAFGIVSMAKRPDLLVDAAADAGCRLAFVGPCVPILAEVISDRAGARGVGDRVEVTGEVDSDAWDQWMEKADLAVQLRDATSGESPAALLEALSCGVPVVTNLASAAELPHATVALVPSPDAHVVRPPSGACWRIARNG